MKKSMKKTMKKTMKNMLSMAAAVLTATIMTACAGADELTDTPQLPENQNRVITLTTTVGLDGANGGATRALTSGGVKTFAAGERMALVYTKAGAGGAKVVVESEALTDGDIERTGDDATDKKSATFTFRLTEAPDKTAPVRYIYPAAMAKSEVAADAELDNEGTVDFTKLNTQDGTMGSLASNLDLATFSDAWVGDNLPGATLTNQLAILAITLKDDVTGTDITGSITGLTLTARNLLHTNSITYNITRSAAPGPIYVAMLPTANADITVTATYGAYTYTKTLTGKTYEINNGYNVSWRMTDVTPTKTVPLTLEALTYGAIVVFDPQPGMKYSTDGGKTKTPMTETTEIDVSAGDKVQFYGDGTSITSYDGTRIADHSAKVKVYGNIMSLVDEFGFATATTLTAQYTFPFLFSCNTALTDASGLLLPATTLAKGCYYCMFDECTSLTTAPALPATTLANECYFGMFRNCFRLKTAPALPATTLANSCYQSMFNLCESLTTAPVLPATTLADNCYQSMFDRCTSLTTAPALPAKTLAFNCYNSMFYGCTKLNAVTCLATNISADGCTLNWLYNAGTQVTGTKTFTTPASTDWTDGINGIPEGWTRVNY